MKITIIRSGYASITFKDYLGLPHLVSTDFLSGAPICRLEVQHTLQHGGGLLQFRSRNAGIVRKNLLQVLLLALQVAFLAVKRCQLEHSRAGLQAVRVRIHKVREERFRLC